jgi:endonuclease/exonuclease/phosphatase family metal-dependent hydrolase
VRIATFNVQNLRLHHAGGDRLDGARDGDLAEDAGLAAAGLDPIDRRLTAQVLRDVDADVVALQEVFDAETLDHFHDRWLVPTGIAPYPHRVCLPGNDGRGLDVALMSRLPVGRVASHAGLTPADLGLAVWPPLRADQPVFRRDCLRATVGRLTLFVCHFKAASPDPAIAWSVRRLEALAVRSLVGRGFPECGYWVIVGDLNEPATPARGEQAIAPLLGGVAIDLTERMPVSERWSYHDLQSGRYSLPDALLASPALARDWPDARPFAVREGLGHEAARYAGPHLPGVGGHRPHASDHAALAVEFAGL